MWISYHDCVLLDAYCCHFLHSFYVVVSSVFRGALCCGPTLGDPLETPWSNQLIQNIGYQLFVMFYSYL